MHKDNKNSIMKEEMETAGNRPKVQCNICDIHFSRKQGLDLHVASVHDKQRPYSCEICNNRFAQKGHLNRHTVSVYEGKK